MTPNPQLPDPQQPVALRFSQWLSAGLAALLVAAVVFALLLGLCFGLSVYAAWTPTFALVSEALAGLGALAVGAWMLALGLRTERSSGADR